MGDLEMAGLMQMDSSHWNLNPTITITSQNFRPITPENETVFLSNPPPSVDWRKACGY
jgi:hypothetical protein